MKRSVLICPFVKITSDGHTESRCYGRNKNLTCGGLYDYIYDQEGTLEGLLKEWLAFDFTQSIYLGPWLINIHCDHLWGSFLEDFYEIKYHCPDIKSLQDIDEIYYKNVLAYKKENNLI